MCVRYNIYQLNCTAAGSIALPLPTITRTPDRTATGKTDPAAAGRGRRAVFWGGDIVRRAHIRILHTLCRVCVWVCKKRKKMAINPYRTPSNGFRELPHMLFIYMYLYIIILYVFAPACVAFSIYENVTWASEREREWGRVNRYEVKYLPTYTWLISINNISLQNGLRPKVRITYAYILLVLKVPISNNQIQIIHHDRYVCVHRMTY